MVTVYRVAGIVGSLRAGSYNRALFRAAVSLLPERLQIVEAPILDVPLFNQDVEDAGDPPAVAGMRQAIESADGVLIFCPEYNAGIPGVLKNALDWASRAHDRQRVLSEKPVGIMGASDGRFGTMRSQLGMRALLSHLGMRMMPKPDVMIAQVETLVDDHGNLTDEKTRERIRDHLVAFHRWIDVFATAEPGKE
ncbi:MAG: NAD(P)H-dependent oxidoreductase [Chloroflexia bacterium]|nr:NAD(P)H-dependent oxidoreductase [Chloroflexia bacterium]